MFGKVKVTILLSIIESILLYLISFEVEKFFISVITSGWVLENFQTYFFDLKNIPILFINRSEETKTYSSLNCRTS